MKLIESINLNNIRGDITGGITAAILALPFALAMGLASGAGAEAGLYGAIITGFYNLMVAVAVGLVMASLVLLQRITELQLEGIVAIQSIEDASHLDESHQELIKKGQTLFYQLNGLMSFGSAKGLVKDFSVRSNYSNAILDLSNDKVHKFLENIGVDNSIIE